MSNFFKDVANRLANKQSIMVDALTQNTPFLARIPMEPASHGLWNVAEKVTSITGGGFVNPDSALQSMSVNTDLENVNLKIMGGIMEVGEDKAVAFGGKESYFASRMPKILRTSGASVESDILANSFRQYAIDNVNTVRSAATTGNTCSTILAITFVEGEVTGLYNPNMWNGNGIFDIADINNGGLYKDSSGILVYGKRIKSMMGIQLLNPRYVSAYINIQSDKLPTADGIDQLLTKARAGEGMQTYLVCHPSVFNYIKKLKNDKVTDFSSSNNIFTGMQAYDGHLIVPTYNMAFGTEVFISA